MSYKWTVQKERHLQELKNADLSPTSEFGRKYLRFARRINTLWNMRENGTASETLYYTSAYDTAYELLDSFNGSGHEYDRHGVYSPKPPHAKEWEQLCEANGFSEDAHVGDWLC